MFFYHYNLTLNECNKLTVYKSSKKTIYMALMFFFTFPKHFHNVQNLSNMFIPNIEWQSSIMTLFCVNEVFG